MQENNFLKLNLKYNFTVSDRNVARSQTFRWCLYIAVIIFLHSIAMYLGTLYVYNLISKIAVIT